MAFEEWWADKNKHPIFFNTALRMYGVDIVKPLVESAWILGREEGRKLTNKSTLTEKDSGFSIS